MMYQLLALSLALLCVAAVPNGYHSNNGGNHDNGGHGNGNSAVVKRIGSGIVPFPQAVDDLQVFPYQDHLVVTGSKFTSIEPDGTCWRCKFNEDFNHCVQLNQTLCTDTITGGECPNDVAIMDCTEITQSSAAGPIYVQVTPYKQIRPSCFITKGMLRLQPVYDSQIYFLQPKLESCTFVIASQIPDKYLQIPTDNGA